EHAPGMRDGPAQSADRVLFLQNQRISLQRIGHRQPRRPAANDQSLNVLHHRRTPVVSEPIASPRYRSTYWSRLLVTAIRSSTQRRAACPSTSRIRVLPTTSAILLASTRGSKLANRYWRSAVPNSAGSPMKGVQTTG